MNKSQKKNHARCIQLSIFDRYCLDIKSHLISELRELRDQLNDFLELDVGTDVCYAELLDRTYEVKESIRKSVKKNSGNSRSTR